MPPPRLRNVLVAASSALALALVAAAVWVVLDLTRVSDAELEEAVGTATAGLDATHREIGAAQIGAAVEDALGSEVTVTRIDFAADAGTAPATIGYQVSAGAPDDADGLLHAGNRWDQRAAQDTDTDTNDSTSDVICVEVTSSDNASAPTRVHAQVGPCRPDR